jgi:hypothetical protein
MRFKTHIFIFFITSILYASAIAQENNIEPKKNSLKIKFLELYDTCEIVSKSIHGFTQLNVFEGKISEEVWWTKNPLCIKGSFEVDSSKSNYLIFNWNKDQANCDWVGIGFGWDGWSAKDMAYLKDSLAFAITLRSSKREISNLPWAFGIEDYNGNQGWIGFKKDFLLKPTIGISWTTILVPLTSFPIIENEVDLTATKQLIIQLFAAGEIELKSIKIVPHNNSKKH